MDPENALHVRRGNLVVDVGPLSRYDIDEIESITRVTSDDMSASALLSSSSDS